MSFPNEEPFETVKENQANEAQLNNFDFVQENNPENNNNFIPMTDDNNHNNNEIFNQFTQPENEEEQKRIALREEEANERRKKIEEKISLELKLKNEFKEKASQFMIDFEK